MANEERITYLREMAAELRAVRHHQHQFNMLCEASAYTDDKLPSQLELQSRITQEINWLDV